MILSQRVGDAKSYVIPMRWNNADFTPSGSYYMIWTLKSNPDTEEDASAKIQKVLSAGITVSGTYATVTLHPVDTAGDADADPVIAALTPGTYFWDLQYQDLSNPDDVKTVRNGTLDLYRDVTRETSASIPIYSDTPISLTSFVTYESAQSLTSAQKEQFFANLGFTAYADLTAANVAFATIGNIYYDRALGRLHINTA
jgi:hypothetical protein